MRCLPREQKIKLGSWTYEQGQLGELPLLTLEAAEGIFKIRQPRLGERADKLLLWLVRNQGGLGVIVNADTPSAIAVSWSESRMDINFLLTLLETNGWVKKHPVEGHAVVTPAGIIHAEEIGTRRSTSSQGFVAMWFAEEMWGKAVYAWDTGQLVGPAGLEPATRPL